MKINSLVGWRLKKLIVKFIYIILFYEMSVVKGDYFLFIYHHSDQFHIHVNSVFFFR